MKNKKRRIKKVKDFWKKRNYWQKLLIVIILFLSMFFLSFIKFYKPDFSNAELTIKNLGCMRDILYFEIENVGTKVVDLNPVDIYVYEPSGDLNDSLSLMRINLNWGLKGTYPAHPGQVGMYNLHDRPINAKFIEGKDYTIVFYFKDMDYIINTTCIPGTGSGPFVGTSRQNLLNIKQEG